MICTWYLDVPGIGICSMILVWFSWVGDSNVCWDMNIVIVVWMPIHGVQWDLMEPFGIHMMGFNMIWSLFLEVKHWKKNQILRWQVHPYTYIGLMFMYGNPCKTYPTHSTPKQYWIRAVTSFHAFDPINNAGYILITTSFLECGARHIVIDYRIMQLLYFRYGI